MSHALSRSRLRIHRVFQEAEIAVFYEGRDGQQRETVVASLPELLDSGAIGPLTSIWTDGLDGWVAFGDSEFSGLVG